MFVKLHLNLLPARFFSHARTKQSFSYLSFIVDFKQIIFTICSLLKHHLSFETESGPFNKKALQADMNNF